MKTRLFTSLLLLTSTPSVLAASAVDLSVKGLITPSACMPQFPGGALIDYGKIAQQDLNLETATRLPVKTLTVGIACTGTVRFALRMRDNRDGSAMVDSEIYYGLGFDVSGNRLGVYSMTFDPRQTQAGNIAQIYGTESTTGGLAWRTSNLNPIDIGSRSYLGFTDVEGSVSGPAAIGLMLSTVTVQTVINARQNLDLSVETPLDGSATLEVVYL
ncbi:hypothetical protein PseBG33_1029 [Pseudomonas synxantha BG33R]|uniref:DUF1120 domain-containing protein n=1 Tax=Pseudomonas TaxID=286 RepID=UPI00025FEA9D|nr:MULTISPECIES: DUF1120 domain-containing protein [Pseudomonas]EIK68844.1 hypothetical protein PseBG33_1029 [Pseudomonas synxantha BG33R]QOY72681.1 DUF1120 domain-containing protein [Pseudomonas sp. OST1909]WPN52964.1 DUF1120 domain-containing protein [Pseudomonas sp. P9_2]